MDVTTGSITELARELRTQQSGGDVQTGGGAPLAPAVPAVASALPTSPSTKVSVDGNVVWALIYALLSGLGMIVINPEATRDESVPCPVQNMQLVAAASAAVFVVAFVAFADALED